MYLHYKKLSRSDFDVSYLLPQALTRLALVGFTSFGRITPKRWPLHSLWLWQQRLQSIAMTRPFALASRMSGSSKIDLSSTRD